MESRKYIHEMNNALTGIVGVVTLLEQLLDESEFEGKEFFKKNVDLLSMAAERAAKAMKKLSIILKEQC